MGNKAIIEFKSVYYCEVLAVKLQKGIEKEEMMPYEQTSNNLTNKIWGPESIWMDSSC